MTWPNGTGTRLAWFQSIRYCFTRHKSACNIFNNLCTTIHTLNITPKTPSGTQHSARAPAKKVCEHHTNTIWDDRPCLQLREGGLDYTAPNLLNSKALTTNTVKEPPHTGGICWGARKTISLQDQHTLQQHCTPSTQRQQFRVHKHCTWSARMSKSLHVASSEPVAKACPLGKNCKMKDYSNGKTTGNGNTGVQGLVSV